MTNEQDVVETWRKHFDDLLNIQDDEDKFPLSYYTAEILVKIQTLEVEKSIGKLKR